MRKKPFTHGMRFTLTKDWLERKRSTSTNWSRPRTRVRVSWLSSKNERQNGSGNRKRDPRDRQTRHESILSLRPSHVPHGIVGRRWFCRVRLFRVDFFRPRHAQRVRLAARLVDGSHLYGVDPSADRLGFRYTLPSRAAFFRSARRQLCGGMYAHTVAQGPDCR